MRVGRPWLNFVCKSGGVSTKTRIQSLFKEREHDFFKKFFRDVDSEEH